MPNANTERLRGIKTLSSLVVYLRDELDWPIEAGDADDITFDYAPSELGIDEKSAVRIKEIKQLRPLTGNQPWGIFFVNFEKKRLPVVIMRLILRALVFKKRASANHAERQAWKPNDLLFISAYGEDTDRAITFAHFVENPGNNLAELRVLGWDDDDTPLHMDYVAQILHDKLRWDAKLSSNPDAWRARWTDAFLLRHRFVITKSDELAEALAVLACRLRARIRTVLRSEDGFGEIRKLQRAFQSGLIHDLNDDGFADMFAQTVTYGLFSVSVRRTFPGEGTAVTKDDVPNLIFTSPFLKDMLGTFLGLKSRKGKIDFDGLGVSDVTDLLTSPDTHMEVVLADFNNKNRGEDPVIHFYEDFLNSYNKELKVQRGVFYTPQPVVSYIVRSVHELLQTEFGLADGLADTTTWGEMIKKNPGLKLPPLTDESGEKRTISPDEPFVQILDPATGTATFPVEVIEVIFQHLKIKWAKGGLSVMPTIKKLNSKIVTFSDYWNNYVPEHLLPRLHAFELMMAPYAIAHMKIGLKLSETGYRFGTEERARIYLTNALEPAGDDKQLKLIGFDALAREAAAVNEIKRHKRFTVVIGNPPYAGYSANDGEWIEQLMEHYKTTVRNEERQIQRLSNDYVKFIRFSESLLVNARIGCLGFITDNGYLNGILFRDMRASLRDTFSNAWINNLHGVAMRGAERHVGIDENVFDITQGVAISILVRAQLTTGSFNYADLIGSRKDKYAALSQSSVGRTAWIPINPSPPKWFFVPSSSNEDYEAWPLFTEIIGTGTPKNDRDSRYGTGIKTRHDEFAVGWTPQDAVARVKQVARRNETDAALIKELGLCTTAHFSISDARRRAEATDLLTHIRAIAYRPFDSRSIVYLRDFICEPKAETMRHMLHPRNLAMAVLRRDRKENGAGFFVARGLIAKDFVSNLDDALVWPLYLVQEGDDLFGKQGVGKIGRPNIAQKTITTLASRLCLAWHEHGNGDLTKSFGPEDIFNYAYAVFHSPGYRNRYAEFLKIDFPRLPLTGDLELFRELAKLGGELVALHLMESPKLDQPITEFIGGRNPEVERISWSKNTVWIDKAQDIGFKGVRENVWNFHIGGYQVCEKWLKDRKGRTLMKDDIAHYHKIVIALAETIRLMAEIDEVIAQHGGWPLK